MLKKLGVNELKIWEFASTKKLMVVFPKMKFNFVNRPIILEGIRLIGKFWRGLKKDIKVISPYI